MRNSLLTLWTLAALISQTPNSRAEENNLPPAPSMNSSEAASSASATIDVQNVQKPRIRPLLELGGGIESTLHQPGIGVLMRAGFGLRRTTNSNLPGPPDQIIYAHISGDVALNTLEDVKKLRRVDITIVPYENLIALSSNAGNAIMGNLQILPTQIRVDDKLNMPFQVRASILGIQLGMVRVVNEDLRVFGQVVANAIGYKMNILAGEDGDRLATFHGFSLAKVGVEAGVAYRMTNAIVLRASLGGSTDTLTVGGSSGFGLNYDHEAFAALKMDIGKMLQVFIQASVHNIWDLGLNTSGATFNSRSSITFLLGLTLFI